MKQKSLDQRIIPLLRLSIFIQILIYLITFNFQLRGPSRHEQFLYIDPSTLLPVLLMGIILIALFIPIVQKKLSKNGILVILFAQTIITIGSRFLFSLIADQNLRSPALGFSRWDTLIFLIIPLVYIAWQYKFTYVIVYCSLVTLTEIIPTAFFTNEDWYLFGIISLGILGRGIILGLVGWIEYRLAEMQRDQQIQLEISNAKLRKYAFTTERLAQSHERNRIARELHDTLAHTLSSVAVQLEAVKTLFDSNSDEAKSLLTKSLENTRNGLKETRRTLKDLRASELETFGLTRAITNVLSSTKERTGINVTTAISEGMDSLPDEINHCLFRVVQEAVENIVRHSNAKNVSIKLFSKNNEVHLQISDDGVGINNNVITKKDNFGIQGMRERVEALGGYFSVSGNPSKGTLIDVSIERDYV
jgi:signal transduction histidine kinase